MWTLRKTCLRCATAVFKQTLMEKNYFSSKCDVYFSVSIPLGFPILYSSTPEVFLQIHNNWSRWLNWSRLLCWLFLIYLIRVRNKFTHCANLLISSHGKLVLKFTKVGIYSQGTDSPAQLYFSTDSSFRYLRYDVKVLKFSLVFFLSQPWSQLQRFF